MDQRKRACRAGAKREREYEDLKKEFKKEGRYREEEVATRIVNEQRARFEERAKKKERGQSHDCHFPIRDHDSLDQVERQLNSLSKGEIRNIKSYEERHETLLERIERT